MSRTERPLAERLFWWIIGGVAVVIAVMVFANWQALTSTARVPQPRPAASTGQGSYLAEQGPVQRSGFWGSPSTISDGQILSVGYTACAYHKQGFSDIDVLTKMAGYRPAVETRAYEVGMDGVRDAVRYLCP